MSSLVRPTAKKSEDSLPDYIVYFERIAAANEWSDEEAAKVFPALLEVGNRHLDSVSEANLKKFTLIKNSLIGSTEPYRESNRSKLMSAVPKPSETIPEFRDRISKLVDLVYPKFAKANKLQLCRDFFVHGLPSSLQSSIVISKAEKIEDAVNAAMLADSLRLDNQEKSSTSVKPRSSFHSNASNNSSSDAQQKYLTYSCHYCNRKGHIAKNCRVKNGDLTAKKNGTDVKKKLDKVSAVSCSRPSRKFVIFCIDGKKVECLLDTGASLSILPAKEFSANLLPKNKLVLLSGDILDNFGMLNAPVADLHGKNLCTHEFSVADIDRVIIGIDLLVKLNAKIYLTENLLKCDNYNFTLYPESVVDADATSDDGNDVPAMLIADADFEEIVYFTSDVEENDGLVSPSKSSTCEKTVFVENVKFNKLVHNYGKLFSGVGKTNLVQHYINTTDNVPINLPAYRIPMHLKTKAKNIIDDLLKNNIISHSKSEFSNPVILAKKKGDDSIRVCLDFRALNAKTRKDAFVCPRIDDIIDKLCHAKFYTKLDVKSAYHNIEIAPEDRHKTAFRFEGNLYEYNRVAFGLCTAPATFCRLVSQVLVDVNDFTTGFFDDIIVFSNSEDEHLAHVDRVLSLLAESGLRLNPKKCVFCVSEVEYLGFKVGNGKVSPAEEKTSVIRNWPVPQTIKDVKRFLGIVGYYRKLIKDFSFIAEPLNALQRKQVKFLWSSECNTSFE
jgi:hypothetical protein